MAININTGFHLGSANHIDDRMMLSKAEMLTINENLFPKYFITLCSDDGKIYIFNKEVESDPVTGKFRVVESGDTAIIQMATMPSPEAGLQGTVYQYTGVTNENYTKGFWYICNATPEVTKTFKKYVNGDSSKVIFKDPDGAYALDNGSVDPLDTTPINESDITSVVDETSFEYNSEAFTYESDVENVVVTPSGFEWAQIDTQPHQKFELKVADTPSVGFLKTYEFYANDNKIGVIDIPKDMVVTSGEIVDVEADTVQIGEEEGGTPIYLAEGEYLKLTIANQTEPVYINVAAIGVPLKLTKEIIPNVEVGGITPDTTLTVGMTLTDVVEKLVVKYFKPEVTLTTTPTNKVVKRGETIFPNLSAKLVKKSNDIVSAEFLKDGVQVKLVNDDTIKYGIEALTYDDVAGITDNTTYKVVASDDTDSTTVEATYEFVDPYYTGVLASDSGIDVSTLSEVVEKCGSKTRLYTANNEFIVFAYPDVYPDLTSILDGNGFENIGSFNKTTQLVGTVTYKVYTTVLPATCTNFKYTFK